jgi:hypothetical protein
VASESSSSDCTPICVEHHSGSHHLSVSTGLCPQRHAPDASRHWGYPFDAMNTILLLKFAGLAHIGLICAGVLMPLVVGLKHHLKDLPTFIRRLFWVYYAFIGMSIVAFGLGTFLLAEDLASGSRLARCLCGFLALFWVLRWVTGTFVFDLSPYLTNRWRRVGLFAADVVFAVLPCVYGYAAFQSPL